MLRFTVAYLDAGTGSMLIQALLGGAAGLAVYLKAKGRRLFRRNSSEAVAAEKTDS